MAIDRAKAFEIPEQGLLLEGGAHFSSGTGAPTHSGLAGDWYFRASDATLWRLPTTGTGWVRFSANQLPFDNTGISFHASDVQEAITEIRREVTYFQTVTAATLNGELTLLHTNNSLHTITGTATGFSVRLPDATTCFNGRKFEINNRSSQAITIKYFGGGSLVTLNAGDTIIVTLQDNSTADGIWISLAISSIAAGVNAFNVVGSVLFQIGSATDTLITGLSVTPPSGTYGIWFSSNINIQANNRIAECVIYKDGVEVTDSRRDQQGVGSNYKGALSTLTITQVNGSQALDVRANVSSGTLDILGRSFLLIRLGA